MRMILNHEQSSLLLMPFKNVHPYYYCVACDSSHYGHTCSEACSINCTKGCRPDNGDCYGCVEGLFGPKCDETCGPGCVSGCDQITGHCTCRQGWQMDNCVGKQYYIVVIFSDCYTLK